MSQLSIINLEMLVNSEHIYRKFLKIWNLTEVDKMITAKPPKITQEGMAQPDYSGAYYYNIWKI